MSQLDFENIDGELMIEDYDDCVSITCQTKGSYAMVLTIYLNQR